MYPLFYHDIENMNRRYELQSIEPEEWKPVYDRLRAFKDILDKEFTELDDIQILAETANDDNWKNGDLPVKVWVALADLLGDIIVYCTSEALRWGIPMMQVMQVIMASNTSKLGADGKPIINPENGKFEKGPNYWKPEPAIEFLLTNPRKEWNRLKFTRSETGVITYEILPAAANENSSDAENQEQPKEGNENGANQQA